MDTIFRASFLDVSILISQVLAGVLQRGSATHKKDAIHRETRYERGVHIEDGPRPSIICAHIYPVNALHYLLSTISVPIGDVGDGARQIVTVPV